MVHAEVHVPMEPPKPDVPIESQVPDAVWDQVVHPPTLQHPIQEETEVPEPRYHNSYPKYLHNQNQ